MNPINEFDPDSEYPPSWRIYFEGRQNYDAFFVDPKKLTDYCNTIPTDISFKIVNQDGIVVYSFVAKQNPMQAAYSQAWLDTQSQDYPHGRKSLYSKTQEALLPSARRRPDASGQLK